MSTSTSQATVHVSPTDGAGTDADLIAAARSGDLDATATLYTRHHDSALRAARAIGGVGLADDLVAEAFTRILTSIRAGGGPDHAVRPYLVTTIRHLFVDTMRRNAREVLVGESSEVVDRIEPDAAEVLLEQSVMVEVLGLLPCRWREVLWRTIVLDEPLSVVGVSMGLNANAVAALNFRARAGLGKAYRERVSATMPPWRGPATGADAQSA